jgi:protein phosphatase PTC7
MGSDGLFDNCFDHEIQSTIESNGLCRGDLKESPQRLAEMLAKKAEEHGADKTWESPFKIAAKGNMYFEGGGKQDDISVIVSQIQLAHEENDE